MGWYIVFGVLFVVPLWQMVPNYRLPQWAALIALIPFGIFVLLWVMAFRDKITIPGIDK
ncbi:hypothetical protein OAN307_c20980 [Octadecabacter antarcticus 307]|uniref:Uncharacterized protein n=1 Tax=Octadecabacter antarcticus 307 TaxID=391626 RepID=M9RD17_9RHOB|nr:hypothetical protein [Octadecabacter antarcticus]AGI67730.1 hypothetical protein OAN307_c20980 [Octadecabacter antarcticus 307]